MPKRSLVSFRSRSDLARMTDRFRRALVLKSSRLQGMRLALGSGRILLDGVALAMLPKQAGIYTAFGGRRNCSWLTHAHYSFRFKVSRYRFAIRRTDYLEQHFHFHTPYAESSVWFRTGRSLHDAYSKPVAREAKGWAWAVSYANLGHKILKPSSLWLARLAQLHATHTKVRGLPGNYRLKSLSNNAGAR